MQSVGRPEGGTTDRSCTPRVKVRLHTGSDLATRQGLIRTEWRKAEQIQGNLYIYSRHTPELGLYF